MQVKNTSNLILNKSNFCIYGQSGAGKTYLASTLQNVILVSIEGGELSLLGKQIDYVTIEGNDCNSKLMSLKNIIIELSKSNYENLYFDSLTEICGLFVESAKLQYPDDKQTMKVWGYVLEKMTIFIKFCRDLNKNTFFTCLEKTEKDEIGRRFRMPDLSGSVAHKLPAYFDFVLNLRTIEKNGEFERKLICIGDENQIAKSRSTKLQKYEEANLSMLIKKIQGEKNG